VKGSPQGKKKIVMRRKNVLTKKKKKKRPGRGTGSEEKPVAIYWGKKKEAIHGKKRTACLIPEPNIH